MGDYDRSCFPIPRSGRQSQCVSFVRSFPVCQGPKRESREQISNITSYIDGSMIYGSTDFVAGKVRDGNCKLLCYISDAIFVEYFVLNIPEYIHRSIYMDT